MKCPNCKRKMRCLDTRWQEATKTTVRRHACVCGVRGKTTERWDSLPAPEGKKPSQPKPKKLPVDSAANRLMNALYAPKKKEKDVVVKHKPTKSMFDDTEEDYTRDNYYDDIGIDIPRGDDW